MWGGFLVVSTAFLGALCAVPSPAAPAEGSSSGMVPAPGLGCMSCFQHQAEPLSRGCCCSQRLCFTWPQLDALSARVGTTTDELSADVPGDFTEMKPWEMAHSVYLCLFLRLVLSGFSVGNAKAVICGFFSYANSILTPWSCSVM